MTLHTLSVPGISCRHCKSTIEGAVEALEGVVDATVDIAQKMVRIEFDELRTPLDRIISVIEDQGFEVASS